MGAWRAIFHGYRCKSVKLIDFDYYRCVLRLDHDGDHIGKAAYRNDFPTWKESNHAEAGER